MYIHVCNKTKGGNKGLPPIKMEIVTKIVFKGYKLMKTISLKHLSFCNMIEIIPRGTA